MSRRVSETVQDRTKVSLLITNRKSYTPFQLVPKLSMTLDDIELSDTHSVQKRCVFWSPPQKKLNEDRPILSAKERMPRTLVSGGIRSLRILRRFPGEGASNDSEVLDSGKFQRFRWQCIRILSR